MENKIGSMFLKSLTPLYKKSILNAMLELPHTLVGATIATQIANPLLALPLALASHFVFDLIPHWNPSLYTETKKLGKPTWQTNAIITIDVILSLIMGFFVALRFWPDTGRIFLVIAACFLAVLPDLVEAPYFYLGVKNPALKKFIAFQHKHQAKAKIIPGLLTQLATIIICLHLILSK